jgi:hypothetical protein
MYREWLGEASVGEVPGAQEVSRDGLGAHRCGANGSVMLST